ncbi:MAG: hypothetical protein RMJ43_13480 [Chloroherpetonaceae bacterium]|nr:hypothetical protein [Chthonomonadaceae bacterium]MDW8208840.1 hypothetical protein [Chloroherpetonaceae bacterium]
MSVVKARHIQEYLARFPCLPEPDPEEETPITPDSTLSLQTAGARALKQTIDLLVAHMAVGLRPRLLRQLLRLATHAEAVVQSAPHLSEKRGEQIERILRQAAALLAAADHHCNRKEQARLAADLSALIDQLI